jgi:outer membrane receptor protein involved in Fe transport
VHLYDIARVEALAGPQGALYGASSESGTIRIITNKPDPSGFSASYGIEDNAVSKGGMGYLASAAGRARVQDHACSFRIRACRDGARAGRRRLGR